MSVENVADLVRSLSPAEQEAVLELVDFLKRKESRTSSPSGGAVFCRGRAIRSSHTLHSVAAADRKAGRHS